MTIYMPTLLITFLVVCVTLMFAVACVARRDTDDGLSDWAWGLALNTVAIVLWAMRGRAPDFLTVVVANTAQAGAYTLFLTALARLQRWSVPPGAVWLPLLAAAGTSLLLESNLQARIVACGLVLVAQQALILYACLHPTHSAIGRGRHLLALAFGILILVSLMRVAGLISGLAIIRDITQNSAVQITLLYAMLVALILGSSGFVLMVKEYADEQARLAAKKDALTGVWNRTHIEEVAQHEINRRQRYGHPVALIMADIDHFKRLNDTFGHSTGDRVLKQFCLVLGNCVRSSDVLARWGGEEFLLLLPNSDLASAAQLAERVRSALAAWCFPEGCAVSASFGVTACQQNETWEHWLHRSDMALYRAKAAGRDRVETEALEKGPGAMGATAAGEGAAV